MEFEVIRREPSEELATYKRVSGTVLRANFCSAYALWRHIAETPGVKNADVDIAWNDYVLARDRWISSRD